MDEPELASSEVVGQPSSPRLFDRLLRDHFALVASAVLGVFVCLKVFAFSRYDLETAAAVVQVLGTANVLTGTLVSMLPMLLMFGAGELMLRRWRWFQSLESVERWAVVSTMAFPAITALTMVPFGFALIYLGLLILVPTTLGWLVKRSQKKKSEADVQTEPMSATERVFLRAAFPAWLFFWAVSTTWLPTESVTVADEKPVMAYVLGKQDDKTVFLVAGRGEGLRVAPTAVVKRAYCTEHTWLDSTLVAMLSGPRYPKCP